MIYIGNNEYPIYLGDSEIPAIYCGEELIYPVNLGTLTGITIEDLVWKTDVPASGGTATEENCTYKVVGHYDSGKSRTVTKDATVTGSLVVPATTAETREMVGVLQLTATYEGFTGTGSVDVYQEAVAVDYLSMPLTFEIVSAGNVVWKASNSSIARSIKYSLDNGSTWTTITSTTGGVSIPVSVGSIIQFKGTNSSYGASNIFNSFSGSDASFNAYGNIMSLINETDFKTLTSFSGSYNFYSLLRDTKLVDAGNLMLPVTACTSNCYRNMFAFITTLIKAPELPATTLASSCYQNMLYGCTALETAPVLPASRLVNACYQGLFYGCTHLNYIKCLATTITGTSQWVENVQTSSGTFVKHPQAAWTRGLSGIPTGWTIIESTE